jgi:DNA-binding NarL/FixJ family response regulator
LIALALQRDPELQAADVSADAIVEAVQATQPGVVILSHNVGGLPEKGLEILKELIAVLPTARVVMLADDENPGLVVSALKLGAHGVFCLSQPLEKLICCVKQVHAGQVWISAAQLDFLLMALANTPAPRMVDTRGTQLLSRREQEVIRWIVEGLSNREIAKELGISQNTVKNYVYRIFDKLGVSNRVEAAMYAAAQYASPAVTAPPSVPPASVPAGVAAADD